MAYLIFSFCLTPKSFQQQLDQSLQGQGPVWVPSRSIRSVWGSAKIPRGGTNVKNVSDRTNEGTSLKATQPKVKKMPYRMALGSFNRKMGSLRAVTFASKPISTNGLAMRSERKTHSFRWQTYIERIVLIRFLTTLPLQYWWFQFKATIFCIPARFTQRAFFFRNSPKFTELQHSLSSNICWPLLPRWHLPVAYLQSLQNFHNCRIFNILSSLQGALLFHHIPSASFYLVGKFDAIVVFAIFITGCSLGQMSSHQLKSCH